MAVITLLARHLPINLTSSDTPDGRKCKYTGQSVRAIPIRVLTVGKKRCRGVQLIVNEYKDKLQNYCSVDDVLVRSNPKNARDVKAQIEEEDFAVVNLIKSNDWVVILDEHGLDVGSERLAELIGDAGLTGASRMTFCIGGPYGHGIQLRQRANLSIKLSSLVLNHQIALVVLMEQLYRISPAILIISGYNRHRSVLDQCLQNAVLGRGTRHAGGRSTCCGGICSE